MRDTPEYDPSLILTPAVRHLINALGGTSRVVGGAVRDLVLNRKIGDIDLATPLHPKEVVETLSKAGIKTVPTGFSHGTITAVFDKTGYEITTLRKDVQTDGRHAHVDFTNDWEQDAARRDFTFNALYMDDRGVLYDYFDGIGDAKAGRIRFIGNARTRIKEDVLRILRFFRFFALFEQGEADQQALEACRELASLIPTLSAERILKELLKLLEAATPVTALSLMKSCGVLDAFLPEADNLSRLQRLLSVEKQHQTPASALVRLASLLPQNADTLTSIAHRLKMSNRDAQRLITLATLPQTIETDLSPATLRRTIYRFGQSACLDAALLTRIDVTQALPVLRSWTPPALPLRGEDIVVMGTPAGPKVGEILKEVEKWWIDGDFTADRAACLDFARGLGKNP